MKQFILIGTIFFAVQYSWGLPQELKPSGGKVEFTAGGKPSFVKIHGTGAAPKGHLSIDGEKVAGQFDLDLSTLDSGIKLRNEHMKNKYLEIEKYPKAVLVLESASKVADWKNGKGKISDATFTGKLTLHGAQKAVKGTFGVAASGKANVSFVVKLSDYNVAVPTFAGITVADEVNVDVEFEKLLSQ